MADGTQMGAGDPGNGVPAQPNDGGPQPPNAPVQPGTLQPVTDPATNPSAPVNHPTPDSASATSDAFAAAMNDTSPDNFLANFLEGNGFAPEAVTGAPAPTAAPGTPPVQAPQGQQTPVQPQGNGVQPPPTGAPQPGQPQPLDPSLLQRLMQPPQVVQQPPPWATQPAPGMPPTPTAYPQQSQPQPAPQQGQPQVDPNAPPVLFNEPFELPPQIKAGLDHDDPNVRGSAIGAAMAMAANTTVARYDKYVKEHVLPQFARASSDQFQQVQFRQTVDRELYGAFPHLRYASPELVNRAAQVVVQDEMSRNPMAANGPITGDVWRRIGQLASAGLQQLTAGQIPTFQPAPQPQPQPVQYQPQFQPQVQYAPVYQPPPIWDGHQWVAQGPQAYVQSQPQTAPIPYVAGQSAAPFGMPNPMSPTPESEVALFMAQGGFNG